jgi:hypothetical protein
MKNKIIRSLTVGLLSVGLFASTATVAGASTSKRSLAAYELQLKDYRAEVQTINLIFQMAVQSATTSYKIALKAPPSTQKTVVAAAEANYKIALEAASTPAERSAARAALAEAVAAAWQNYGNALKSSNTAAMSAALAAFNSAVTAAVLAQQNAITALGPKPVPPTK